MTILLASLKQMIEKQKVQKPEIDISIEDKRKFIVDERFIDVFRKQFRKSSLQEFKQELKDIVEFAENIESLMDSMEERIYLHKIITHPNLNTDPS